MSLGFGGGRGYIRGVKPSDLPLRYKVMMILAYLIGTAAIFLVVNYVFRGLLSPNIAALLGMGIVGFVLGYFWRVYREVSGRPPEHHSGTRHQSCQGGFVPR